jgi:chromosome partitioning protein
MHRLFQELGTSLKATYIFVDLGPNVGALNRSALIVTDGFVVPLAPDLFSLMALPGVGNSIREWSRQWNTALTNVPGSINLSLPSGKPKPLGYVSQQFSVYANRPTAAFREWLGRLEEEYKGGVLTPLNVTVGDKEWQLGALQNFASLIPLSQKASKGLFELSGRQARRAQYTRAQESFGMFSDIAKGIIAGLDT